MNCSQAKNINISQIINYDPEYKKNGSLWYISPFRKERNASFQVDENKNIWFDHGAGEGGTVIDLVCRLQNCSIQTALQLLSNKKILCEPATRQIVKEKNQLIFLNEDKKLNSVFYRYAKNRGINKNLIDKYCTTVRYLNNEHEFFSLAFKNIRGGFELRNENFKACIAPKAYTKIEGKYSTQINLYEGFFSFLSHLQLKKIDVPVYDSIILNSLSMLAGLDFTGYQYINCWLDNDEAGQKAFKKLSSCYPCRNNSKTYFPEYKDFNEYLKSL